MLLGLAVRQGQAPLGSPLRGWEAAASASVLSRLVLQLVLQMGT